MAAPRAAVIDIAAALGCCWIIGVPGGFTIMSFRPIVYLAVAIGLFFVSRSVELRGDLAPLVAGGVSPERAKYHLIALVLLLGALGFFIAAGVSAFRGRRG